MEPERRDPRYEIEPFSPTGAIAFFVAMIAVYAACWGAMYVLLVQRG